MDEARWRSVGAALAASPFETLELKRTFNAYSDNIYYATGSAEANAYLLGGSTPCARRGPPARLSAQHSREGYPIICSGCVLP